MINKTHFSHFALDEGRRLGLGDLLTRFHLSEQVEMLYFARPNGQRTACVAKWAGSRERALYRFVLTDRDAPRLLASLPVSEGSRWWLLLEALEQEFPDLRDPVQIRAIYRHVGHFHHRYAQGGGRTLVHGDLHRWNMVWHQSKLRLLDWETSHYGDPLEDLALLEPELESDRHSELVPTGAMAELALQTYHRSGPMDGLSWSELIRRQRLIRLINATRIATRHQRVASSLPDGEARAVVLEHARMEWQRVKRLRDLCGE